MPNKIEQHKKYSDEVFNRIAKIEKAIDSARRAIQFASGWDDENAMFYSYVIQEFLDQALVFQAMRANLERLTELADQNTPEDLPF